MAGTCVAFPARMSHPRLAVRPARITRSASEIWSTVTCARPGCAAMRFCSRIAGLVLATAWVLLSTPETSLALLSAPSLTLGAAVEARLCPVSRCGRRQPERDSFLESRDRAETELYFKEVRAQELVYV